MTNKQSSFRNWQLTFAALLSCASLLAQAAPHQSRNSSIAMDHQVAATLDSIAYGNLSEARVLARQLSKQFPKFALGHLLSAELEAAAAFQDVRASSLAPMNQRLIDLLLEAQFRLKATRTQRTASNQMDSGAAPVLPSSVIQMGTDIDSLLIVDLDNSTIKHIAGTDESPTIIRQHYMGSGKAGFGKEIEGDNKTPLGVYTITGKRHDSTLPDLYGSGALTLNYPNALDRFLGRTGYGIWIHGVPHAQRSRAPRSSEGCVTMSNDHLLSLMQQIEPSKSLVVLTNNLSYISEESRHSQKHEFRTLFTKYQNALLSKQPLEIANLYDNSSNIVRAPNTESYKQYIQNVSPSDLSIILNPSLNSHDAAEDAPFLVMRGRYGAHNELPFALYWKRSNEGEWRIATELRQGPNAS
ncbi:MAG: murein L,D-transpeptidase family protein [Granulosicoccus sp.]